MRDAKRPWTANLPPETDIELAVRHPATGTKQAWPSSLNPGGPGASGFDFVYDSLDFAASADLQAAFDVVGLGSPRSAGRRP